ncbi:hypothetical protein [Frondihabitans australicus]|uniref:Uncharacterized protein n=1 Tax=Frondihabitans australicus TaxID=386892 RepID=A0A495IMF4_9MICO|nr:hypothetical protein [Frondihabitans australicus]RKR76305.1 hypothetical protein C8E83_3474 [Frondihabitans australicus]
MDGELDELLARSAPRVTVAGDGIDRELDAVSVAAEAAVSRPRTRRRNAIIAASVVAVVAASTATAAAAALPNWNPFYYSPGVVPDARATVQVTSTSACFINLHITDTPAWKEKIAHQIFSTVDLRSINVDTAVKYTKSQAYLDNTDTSNGVAYYRAEAVANYAIHLLDQGMQKRGLTGYGVGEDIACHRTDGE